MRTLLNVVRFLTIIPIGKDEGSLAGWGISVALFPIVGFLIGVAMGGVYRGALYLTPESVALILAIGFACIITGGLHLDGLADSADGIFGGWNREERLKIMRDKAVGAYGVLALVLVLAVRYVCLLEVKATFRLLCLMPMVGRWGILLAASISSYAREDEGMGRAPLESTSVRHLVLGSVFPVLMCFALLGLRGIAMTAMTFVIVPLIILFIVRRIGGMTGDTLGAISEVTETLFVICYFPATKLLM